MSDELKVDSNPFTFDVNVIDLVSSNKPDHETIIDDDGNIVMTRRTPSDGKCCCMPKTFADYNPNQCFLCQQNMTRSALSNPQFSYPVGLRCLCENNTFHQIQLLFCSPYCFENKWENQKASHSIPFILELGNIPGLLYFG